MTHRHLERGFGIAILVFVACLVAFIVTQL